MSETQEIRIEDQAVLENKPVVKEEKQDFKSKSIPMEDLTYNQRTLLRGGFKDLGLNHPAYNSLGNLHKQLFMDTCTMMSDNHALVVLPIHGEEFWKTVDQKKQRFVKFAFDFIIPGTIAKMSFVKVWRYEDFTP